MIIPPMWKNDIDAMMEQELVNANRYFAETNPRISELVSRQSSLSPERFVAELRSRWGWHNIFYEELLEPALPTLLETDVFQLSLGQIALIREVYRISSLVDQATLIMSAAIKKHISLWTNCLPVCTRLGSEEMNLLLSLPGIPYPVQYLIDHINYTVLVKLRAKGAEVERKRLIRLYHADDETIFNGRMKKLELLEKRSVRTLRRKVASLSQGATRATEHFYLTVERPILRAIRDSLSYDNNDEKQIVQELIGISGFILRKKVIGYLQRTKILNTEGGIYSYQDDVVDQGLEKLLAYRQQAMYRKVVPYRQHGPNCSAACLVMTAHHLGKGDLTERFEREIAEASNSRLMEGQHYSGIASYAVSMGLEVVLLHSSPNLFNNDSGWIPNAMFELLMAEYRTYLKSMTDSPLAKIERGAKLDPTVLKDYIRRGYLVMIAGVMGGGILHSKLLTGYNSGGFIVIDPLTGTQQQIDPWPLSRFMETKIGQWALAIRPDQSYVATLQAALPNFEAKARHYLK